MESVVQGMILVVELKVEGCKLVPVRVGAFCSDNTTPCAKSPAAEKDKGPSGESHGIYCVCPGVRGGVDTLTRPCLRRDSVVSRVDKGVAIGNCCVGHIGLRAYLLELPHGSSSSKSYGWLGGGENRPGGVVEARGCLPGICGLIYLYLPVFTCIYLDRP
jgi:hypothetical protein